MVNKEKWKLAHIPVEDVVPADLNANKMSDSDFEQLCKNISDSGMSSVVTCYHRNFDKKFVIISGHHRYRACVKDGYNTVPCIYAEEDDLSRDEIIAIQLSHNSLHGEDDKGILKRLFEEIQSIEFKQFSHINVSEIENINTFASSIAPVAEHFVMTLILYKSDLKLLDELLEGVRDGLKKGELVMLANQDPDEEIMMALVREIRHRYTIKSTNVTFSKILELAKKAMDNEAKKEAI